MLGTKKIRRIERFQTKSSCPAYRVLAPPHGASTSSTRWAADKDAAERAEVLFQDARRARSPASALAGERREAESSAQRQCRARCLATSARTGNAALRERTREESKPTSIYSEVCVARADKDAVWKPIKVRTFEGEDSGFVRVLSDTGKVSSKGVPVKLEFMTMSSYSGE